MLGPQEDTVLCLSRLQFLLNTATAGFFASAPKTLKKKRMFTKYQMIQEQINVCQIEFGGAIFDSQNFVEPTARKKRWEVGAQK